MLQRRVGERAVIDRWLEGEVIPGSLKSGILTYEGSPVPDNTLDVVVIDSIFENTLYAGKYDPSKLSSPDCFALGHEKNDLKPHEMAVAPANGSCASCPNLEWGSKEGSRGKACQERRRLIVIPATSATTDDDILAAEVAVMKLPVTSTKYWSQYINNLASLHKRPAFAAITTIKVSPDSKSQFRVDYACKDMLSMEVIEAIMQKRELVQEILMKPYERSEDSSTSDNKKLG